MSKMIEDRVILQRLADGDAIFYSQDGDTAWFKSNGARADDAAVIRLRELRLIERRCDDEENYRGLSEYDAISEAGRVALNRN